MIWNDEFADWTWLLLVESVVAALVDVDNDLPSLWTKASRNRKKKQVNNEDTLPFRSASADDRHLRRHPPEAHTGSVLCNGA